MPKEVVWKTVRGTGIYATLTSRAGTVAVSAGVRSFPPFVGTYSLTAIAGEKRGGTQSPYEHSRHSMASPSLGYERP